MKSKVVSAEEAVLLIEDNDTVASCGNGVLLMPDKVLEALERRFLTTGRPRNLTEVHPIIVGRKENTGTERFAHEGLVRKTLGSSYNIWGAQRLFQMINENKIEAYTFPMGVMFHLLRATASGQPGVITPVGLHSYMDPRLGGGKMNEITQEDLVEIITLNGKEYLYYKSFPIDVAVIRGTTADAEGNITMEHEYVELGVLMFAMAAKNCEGRVIAQVKRVAAKNSLSPRDIVVPGILVDRIVIDEDQDRCVGGYDPYRSGEMKSPIEKTVSPLSMRKTIARRAILELKSGQIVNLGYGQPVEIANIAIEESLWEKVVFSVEHGPLGGIPVNKDTFGAFINPTTIMDSLDVFTFYNGGGLDISFLGMAEVDRNGNVNVSKFGDYCPSSGGFADIVHKTPKIVFCGTFSAKGLQLEITEAGIRIVKEGEHKKFVKSVQQLTFNGVEAWRKHQEVLYVTERATFKLAEKGIELIEIAPGANIEKDILPNMEFEPIIERAPRTMDKRIYQDKPMKLNW